MALAISSEEFRRLAERAARELSEFNEQLETLPVFPVGSTGEGVARVFDEPLPEKGMGPEAFEQLAKVFQHSRVGNGRFFAYVLGSGEPVGAIGDFYASMLNQNVTAWRSGPAAVNVEQAVIRWIAEAVGCDGFTGNLTGGGSSANLMGLAMAREAHAEANEDGARGGIVYASSEIHMSIPKAMALLGLGRKALRLMAVDENFKIRLDALENAIAEDRRAGKKPIAIVASAGTVNTGAVDPMRDLAEVARRHGMWLHVDGAYGALAAMAHPEKFAGLELADSISLDAHKWLYQPLDCGVLLFRDAAHARKTFAYSGDYAKALSHDPIEGFAYFEETMELSRRFRALKLWLSLRYHGVRAFRQAIARNIEQAQMLALKIAERTELELLAPAELSAVCFRWIEGGGDLDRRNAEILQEVVHGGRVYISNATIRGKFALRACITNHRSTDEDVMAILQEVERAAKRGS